MERTRYLYDLIVPEHLKSRKMILISGPRQVGKTTLSKQIGSNFKNHTYLNWDDIDDRLRIRNREFSSFTILDEIHKSKQWKSFVKGIYDKSKEEVLLCITGSSRIDVYKKGGDSLIGRYFHYLLHPFSAGELSNNHIVLPKNIDCENYQDIQETVINDLLKFSGFPEPFLRKEEVFYKKWRNQRLEKILKEDLRDLENLKMIELVEYLYQLGKNTVGSTFSINSFRETLNISFPTTAHYWKILESLYLYFSIPPYSKSIARSLTKERKAYLWDYADLTNESAAFENLIASHLLKYVHFLQNTYGENINLFYIRDREKREVDFLLEYENKPWMLIETKLDTTEIHKNSLYYKNNLNVPYSIQVIKKPHVFIKKDAQIILSANKFLGVLGI